MDKKYHQFDVNSSKIHLLEFTDDFDPQNYLDTLSAEEIERYFSFKHDKRKREFVATRILKHELFAYQEIKYHDHGAPFMEDTGFISISHGPNLVGIATNSQHKIGFDIEKISDKTKKIYPKYLNKHEESIFDIESEFDLTSAWSLKESMYKLAGRKLIDFKKDLLLLEKKSGNFSAKICNPKEEILLELTCFQFQDKVITINSNAVNHVPK